MSDVSPRPEVWRPVPGYEGFYEVSNEGRVKALERTVPYRRKYRTGTKTYKERVLTPTPTSGARYLSVGLHRDNKRSTRHVHVLVCEAFHGPRPSPKYVTRHLNGQHRDNRAENLAWGSQSENALDAIRHGTHSSAAKTRCAQGHKFTPENTYRMPSNPRMRQCRICRRANQLRAYLNLPSVQLVCEGCGEAFMRRVRSGRGRRYCSQGCASRTYWRTRSLDKATA